MFCLQFLIPLYFFIWLLTKLWLFRYAGENRDADIVRLSATEVRVSYSLTASQQRALSEQGVSGQFVVQYDIEREKDSGEVLVLTDLYSRNVQG